MQHLTQSLISERDALAALGGNRKLLCELAQIFVEDMPNLTAELETAVGNDDVELARRSVHSIKGLCATFYAETTVDLARKIEVELAAGCVDSMHSDGYIQLKEAVERLTDELRRRGFAT